MEVDEKFGYASVEEMCIDWENSGLSEEEFCNQLCEDSCEDVFFEDGCDDILRDCIEDCELRLEHCWLGVKLGHLLDEAE